MGTREQAARVADALRKEPDVDVKVVDGSPGELTVLVDGQEVARKGDSAPDVNDVLAAVRRARPAAGARP
jgi:uncharacterized Zn-binding protein involved in type VI secretion